MTARLTPERLKAAPRTLHTPRLRLESPRAAHAEAFADGLAASMPALVHITWGLSERNVDWARRFCEGDAHSVEQGEDLVFHAFEQPAAEGHSGWVGRIDVHSIDFHACRGEIGYVGDVRRAGQGLMREAVLAVVDLCFAVGFQRLEALSDARNVRALRFAEQALGLQREGVLRRHERDPHGALCDMVVFAALNPRAEAAA